MATKTPTTSAKGGSASGGKPAKSPKATKKPKTAAPKKIASEKPKAELDMPKAEAVEHEKAPVHHEPKAPTNKERYIFATGRRKTAVANVRLFEGKGDQIVNKKPISQYFAYSFHLEEISKPLEVTGLAGKYFFTAHVNGGGPHAQATALRHGVSMALGKISEDVRKVLKKNGFLTRDDRKKERKKPGLKRARRSPQWAKR